MASPSDIPNHPLAQMVDYQGDAFPTGSSYFIKNVCSNFYQALAFNQNVPGAVTCTAQPDPNCKWQIQYENNDRSRVAIKSAANGQYLAATSPDCKAPIGLSDQMVFWWVHQGSAPGTYWLSTTQTKDCFLHTWDCQSNEGSLVASFTNRDPKWSNFYNQPYSMFEDWSSGMSWGLDPTPELMQWKEQQKAVPEGQQSQVDAEELKKREQAAAESERQIQERDAELQRKYDELSKREQELAAKEKGAATGEASLKEKEQAFETKSQDFEKSYDELKKREEAVRAAEERVKKSKKGGKADHLATQEEKDKLQEETKNLQSELEATRKDIGQLKEQLQKSQQQKPSQSLSATGSSRQASSSGFGKMQFTIRSPEVKRPLQQLPEKTRLSRKLPESKKPGEHLPTGYNAGMMQRFEAGKKAMSMKA